MYPCEYKFKVFCPVGHYPCVFTITEHPRFHFLVIECPDEHGDPECPKCLKENLEWIMEKHPEQVPMQLLQLWLHRNPRS